MSGGQFKSRLTQEPRELADRLEKIQTLIESSPVFPTLPLAEQTRISRQEYHMRLYLDILRERLEFYGIEVES